MTDISSSFFCPITCGLMEDPVVDPEGNSYERHAIEEWIRQNGRSPITRTILSIDDLRPNRALKETIDQHRHSIPSDIRLKPLPIIVNTSEITAIGNHANGFIHVSIQPPLNENRSPCDICCVVDTSGSMKEHAEVQNDKNERYGLSQLDLVKHALKTIVQSLEIQDRLSIVSFSSHATIVCQLTRMDEQGRQSALTAIDRLSGGGQTNLWDGLQTGLNILSQEQNTAGSISALFLLTDGCPNVEPTGGHLQALENLKKTTNFSCIVNTFGFGYQLSSKLLEDIAILGNSGSYAFIPDGSFVGTIFVNAISTLLTTAATNIQLLVHGKPLEPTEYTQWYSTSNTDQGTTFHLGSMTYGQSKDLLIPFASKSVDQCSFTLTYDSVGEKKKSIQFGVKKISQQADLEQIIRHKFRLEFVHCIRTTLEQLRENKVKLGSHKKGLSETTGSITLLKEEMTKYANENDEFIKDLLADLTGQVQLALEKEDWFMKWGIHYLPSLTRAHLLQFCNNFKDPGVQHYGKGVLFSTVRDDMDGIFCGLPAPKSSIVTTKIDMTVFHNASGGCFHGDCTVRLMDGTVKLIKNVKPGDRMAPSGDTVTYVIKTICRNRKSKMVILENGLIITAWHPIRVDQQWMMPCSLVTAPCEIDCDAVFNFALDQGHTVLVNDVECVTLGHGFQDDIVRHAYYGSQRVIEDLHKLDLEQNRTGLIEITEDTLIRSPQTGLVRGLQLPEIVVQ